MDEAYEILKSTLDPEESPELNLAEMIRHYIDPVGGADLVIPPREPVRRAPKFTKCFGEDIGIDDDQLTE